LYNVIFPDMAGRWGVGSGRSKGVWWLVEGGSEKEEEEGGGRGVQGLEGRKGVRRGVKEGLAGRMEGKMKGRERMKW
jgi:hypothetical protein